MLDIFRGLKNFIKVSRVHTDSPVFRLHYSITVMILLAFSLIVTTRQYVGNPIDCIYTHNSKLTDDVVNTYCWIHSTYTVKSQHNDPVPSKSLYPGIGPLKNFQTPGTHYYKPMPEKVYDPPWDTQDESQDEYKFVMYYQWVCFVLFFQ
ncbi:unnamed protein product, partial [Cyprideis torosa]